MSPGWMVAWLVLAASVACLAVLQLGLMRRVLATLDHLERHGSVQGGVPDVQTGVSTGVTLPPTMALDAHGQPVDVFGFDPAQHTVVLLASGECAPCHLLLESLLKDGWTQRARLLIILDGPSEFDNALRAAPFSVAWETPEGEVARALGSNVYPTALGLTGNTVTTPPAVPDSAADLHDIAGNLAGLHHHTIR